MRSCVSIYDKSKELENHYNVSICMVRLTVCEVGVGDYGKQSTVLAYLSEVCWVPHHVNVEQFGHIARPCVIVLLLEGRSDVRTLLVHQVPLVLGRFAGPDCSNKITYTHCHRHLRPNSERSEFVNDKHCIILLLHIMVLATSSTVTSYTRLFL